MTNTTVSAIKNVMAGVAGPLPPSIPALDFDLVRNRLLNELNRPPNVPYQWTPQGPLRDIYNLKSFFTTRFANFPKNVLKKAIGKVALPAGAIENPGPGGPQSLRTPQKVAASMHKYVQNRISKKVGWKFNNKKYAANLIKYLSTACQNKRAGTCNTHKIVYAGGIPTFPYMRRDVNPGCASSLAALFDIFYGGTGVPVTFSKKSSRLIAREASRYLTQRREKVPFGKTWIYPSSACPCIKTPKVCKGIKQCKWIPAAGKIPEGCVPRGNIPALGTESFPGVDLFAGQRYFDLAPEPIRPGSHYVKKPAAKAGVKSVWYRLPAAAPLPNVDY